MAWPVNEYLDCYEYLNSYHIYHDIFFALQNGNEEGETAEMVWSANINICSVSLDCLTLYLSIARKSGGSTIASLTYW